MIAVAILIGDRENAQMTATLHRQVDSMCNKPVMADVYIVESVNNMMLQKNYGACDVYEDSQFLSGKVFGHNKAFEQAQITGKDYCYYWVLMNDVYFPHGQNALQSLVDVMEANPGIGILSPCTPQRKFVGCEKRNGVNYHIVAMVEYLGFMIRADLVRKVAKKYSGYRSGSGKTLRIFNPAFRYARGAMNELAYFAWKEGYTSAYCDCAVMYDHGGTTYGKKKGLPTAVEYRQRGAEFAAEYFRVNYGEKWDRELYDACSPDVEENTFAAHRRCWERDRVKTNVEDMTVFELGMLKSIMQQQPIGVYLEIGSRNGESLEELAGELVPEAKIISVDYSQNKRSRKKLESVARRLQSRGFDITLINGLSQDIETVRQVKKCLAEESVSMLFIDGEHSMYAAMDDLRNYEPMVARGGLVVFHDCGFVQGQYETRHPNRYNRGRNEVNAVFRAYAYKRRHVMIQQNYGIGIAWRD